MKILAFILDQEVIERILHHIGEDPTPPRVLPARSPPQLAMPFAQTTGPVTWPEMNQTTEFPDELYAFAVAKESTGWWGLCGDGAVRGRSGSDGLLTEKGDTCVRLRGRRA